MDGVAGLEPANDRIKICCLTNLTIPQQEDFRIANLRILRVKCNLRLHASTSVNAKKPAGFADGLAKMGSTGVLKPPQLKVSSGKN